MIALIDTHVFIWSDTDPGRLSPTVLGYFADPAYEIVLSTASIWEAAIKVAAGKLTLTAPIEQVIADVQANNPLRILPVEWPQAVAAARLPSIHRDPFDRVLVAQALALNAVILTKDQNVRQYPVRTDW